MPAGVLFISDIVDVNKWEIDFLDSDVESAEDRVFTAASRVVDQV